MSLVAYVASDDSEQSDTEDNEQLSNNEKKSVKDQISDDEEYQAVSSSSSTLISDYPLNNVVSDTFSSLASISPITTHQDLPPPQKREDVTIEETELEEEVRQKPSELAGAPKPPPKKAKQPVKITIPSLDEIPEEEDDHKRKATISSTKPSGLFSLLPPPIHSAKKEINRPLIPHSLGRKPPPPTKPAVQAKSVSSSTPGSSNSNTDIQTTDNVKKRTTAHSTLIGYDSDDDDEDEAGTSNNFFSLGSSSSSKVKETDSVSSTTDNNKPNVIVNKDNEKGENSATEETITSSPEEEEEEEVVGRAEPGLTNDSPLDFGNASRFSSWSSASSSYLGGLIPNRPGSHAYHPSNLPQSSVQYNMADADDTDAIDTEVNSDDLQHVMNDKEFQKLQGKRKRGMEGAISFVDAKVDDYVDPSELSKYITEETDYTSTKKNKDDMPTSQQKRKKQITYLAFQAKEKELELKNTWSQNRLTKRQTQAKYGF